MNNLRPFQIILLGVFGLFAIIGIAYFGFYQGGDEDQEPYASGVTIWGTLDERSFNGVLDELSNTYDNFDSVEYIQKSPDRFNIDLLNAIAENGAPDLIVLPSTEIVTHRAKLFALSAETFPQNVYREMYVDGADIFLLSDGTYGLPFAVDPLVMYWNRDMFATNGLANPPRTWEELVGTTLPALNRVLSNKSITQSAIAFGEYANVYNAKEILSMLFLQAGTTIVEEGQGRMYVVTARERTQPGLPPAEAALSFYTQFALPTSASYSWNRALPVDRTSFTSNTLGLYFGAASEQPSLERANPNLNLGIATVPQGVSATVSRNYATFYGLAIPRASSNPQGALAVAQILSGPSAGPLLADALDMAPVHRSVIAAGTTGVRTQVLYTSALIARGWLDPDSAGSESAFQTMVEDVTSGRERVSAAVESMIARLRLLF